MEIAQIGVGGNPRDYVVDLTFDAGAVHVEGIVNMKGFVEQKAADHPGGKDDDRHDQKQRSHGRQTGGLDPCAQTSVERFEDNGDHRRPEERIEEGLQ